MHQDLSRQSVGTSLVCVVILLVSAGARAQPEASEPAVELEPDAESATQPPTPIPNPYRIGLPDVQDLPPIPNPYRIGLADVETLGTSDATRNGLRLLEDDPVEEDVAARMALAIPGGLGVGLVYTVVPAVVGGIVGLVPGVIIGLIGAFLQSVYNALTRSHSTGAFLFGLAIGAGGGAALAGTVGFVFGVGRGAGVGGQLIDARRSSQGGVAGAFVGLIAALGVLLLSPPAGAVCLLPFVLLGAAVGQELGLAYGWVDPPGRWQLIPFR